MNDERFFDLAMKVIARQATDAERAELDALLASDAKLRSAFEQLEADVRVAKDALPLVDASQATAGELPGYARGRLQTKVRETFGSPAAEKAPDRSLALGWRWVLGLAAAAVVLFVALPMFRTPSMPVIQLAMLDTADGTRGSDTNETGLLLKDWPSATLDSFTSTEALREWQSKGRPEAVKIIYDRAVAEVRVFGQWHGKSFEKTFPVEQDLATTLAQAKDFIGEQTKE